MKLEERDLKAEKSKEEERTEETKIVEDIETID